MSNNCDSNRFVASRFEELPLGEHMYYIQRCTLGDFCERNTVCAEDFFDFLRNLDICRVSPKNSESNHFSNRVFQELTFVWYMNHIARYVYVDLVNQRLVGARDFLRQVLKCDKLENSR